MDALKKTVLNQIEPFDFFILLCAFFYGNLFALQFSTINWGFLLILIIVFFLETINKFLYFMFENIKKFSIKKKPVLTKTYTRPGISYFSLVKKRKKFLKYSFILTNLVKRGFLLGFFVEAFKVGS